MKIKADSFIKSLVAKAYPDYKGRKFSLNVTEKPINCASSWQDGSRDFFTFANLTTGEVSQAAPAQSGYEKTVRGLDAVELPLDFVAIEHSIFCGKDSGITIHVRPENTTRFLTAGTKVTL